jgi:hypothetical protein
MSIQSIIDNLLYLPASPNPYSLARYFPNAVSEPVDGLSLVGYPNQGAVAPANPPAGALYVAAP